MSYWTTRSTNKNTDYIVIRHTLRGVNGKINGIIFRDSYGVVEKNSKAHKMLKRIPQLKNADEKPITFLNKLNFITRSRDIEKVYGKDVYTKYLLAVKQEAEQVKLAKEAQEEEELQQRAEQIKLKQELEQKLKEAQLPEEVERIEESISEMPQMDKCSFFNKVDNKPCKKDAYEASPSGYCKMHIFHDPKLPEFGIEIPKYLTKSEKKKLRTEIYKKLEKLKKSGAF